MYGGPETPPAPRRRAGYPPPYPEPAKQLRPRRAAVAAPVMKGIAIRRRGRIRAHGPSQQPTPAPSSGSTAARPPRAAPARPTVRRAWGTTFRVRDAVAVRPAGGRRGSLHAVAGAGAVCLGSNQLRLATALMTRQSDDGTYHAKSQRRRGDIRGVSQFCHHLGQGRGQPPLVCRRSFSLAVLADLLFNRPA